MASKKKTKPPHIAMHLPTQPHELYTHCAASWAAVKADQAHFATPYPAAAEIDADLASLSAALQAAEGGDPAAISALAVAADKVRQTFGILGKYVESVVRAGPIEDAPAIISNVLMYESNVGKRPPKPALDAQQGKSSGVVLLVALAIASVTAYFWEFSLDQQTWTAGGETSQAHTSIPGLTPGKLYYFRFRALKRAGGLTDPSQIVSFMVK